ncbi:MAG: hypothetical protein M1817_000290 [Caeruleum heppii]|nr:MAG: hypothetical protein M1817_000290 [Caeruleum heppii]
MDPLQTRALDALAPFLALSKTANSPRAAADLITRATSARNTYIFAELLATPNVQGLRAAEDPALARYLRVLELFAWGTWAEYQADPSLPELNPDQTHKLQLLTLLSLATNPENLNYATLQKSLDLPTPRALESLVIAATYAGLLTARLSPATKTVHITSISPLRDVAPGTIPAMTASLAEWEGRCTSVLGSLEGQIREVKRRAGERKKRDEAMRGQVERVLRERGMGADGNKGSGKRAADADASGLEWTKEMMEMDEGMDLDEADQGNQKMLGAVGQGRKNARTGFGGKKGR